MLPNDGQKHSIQFYNSASVETDSTELNYVVIAATDKMLDEIGGLIHASGARFPSDETTARQFRFNKVTAQELIWIGLQLMGAARLSFDADWDLSGDDSFHATWEQDSTDKGHFILHLFNPEFADGREIELRNHAGFIDWRYVGDSSWTHLIALADITGPKGDKGDTGDTGEQGIQGIQGIQGEQGIQGDTGEKGDKGDTGDTGATGSSGSKGDKGDTGDTGPQGETGETGADGTDCDCGAVPNNSGSNGATLRCSVASFVGQMVKNQWDHYIDDDHATASALTTGTASLLSLGALVLAPEVGVIITLFSILAAAVASLELSSIYSLGKASFTDTVIANVASDLFCSLDNDGKITDAVKSDWAEKVLARSTSTADVYDLAATRFISALPVEVYQVGAMKAPVLANADACADYDCAANWCHKWLGTTGKQTLGSATYGSYDLSQDKIISSDVGSGNNWSGIDIPGDMTVTDIEFDVIYDNTASYGAAGIGIAVDAAPPESQNLYQVLTPTGTGSIHIHYNNPSGYHFSTKIRLFASGFPTVTGDIKIDNIVVHGNGISPFGLDNC